MTDDPRLAALAAALHFRNLGCSMPWSECPGYPERHGADAAATLAALDGWTLTRKPPEGTRLILATIDVLPKWGTRTDDGRRLTAEWGEPDENGWYSPVWTASGEAEIVRLREALDEIERTTREEGTQAIARAALAGGSE